MEPGAFERWDAQPLLQQLRAALGSERPVPREIPGATPPEGVCALAERGRLAAARAKLRGEKVAVRPRRTAALQAELQAKFPQPRDGPDELLTGEQFERNADEVAALVRDIDVADRITTDDFLRAVRGVRGTAAPGPDGWTRGYLCRIATLFPRQVGELMQRDSNALATTHDALRVCAVTASTVAGLPKPQANDDDAALQPGVPAHRPIVIANVVARCILNLVTARAKPALRKKMEQGGQFGMSGVAAALLPPLKMVGRCATEGVPWAWFARDTRNAFNAVSQAASSRSVMQLARVAPEWAACALRDQCLVSGPIDMPRCGEQQATLPSACRPLCARRTPRIAIDACNTFGGVICETEAAAESRMRRVRRDMSSETALAEIWGACREVEPRVAPEPPDSVRAAVDELMRFPRPGDWGGTHGDCQAKEGELSSLYSAIGDRS